MFNKPDTYKSPPLCSAQSHALFKTSTLLILNKILLTLNQCCKSGPFFGSGSGSGFKNTDPNPEDPKKTRSDRIRNTALEAKTEIMILGLSPNLFVIVLKTTHTIFFCSGNNLDVRKVLECSLPETARMPHWIVVKHAVKYVLLPSTLLG